MNAHTKGVTYICQSYQASHHRHGENQSGCGRNTVSHADAVRLIQEMNYDIEFFFVQHEWKLEEALLAIAPVFRDGHTPTVEEVSEIDTGLEKLGVGLSDTAGHRAEEARLLLTRKREEYEKWVAAKVLAGSDPERRVIEARVRGLEAEIAGLEHQTAPADLTEQTLSCFRAALQDAIRAADPGVLSNKLRQMYTKIVLRFRHERTGRRMRSCLIPDQTEFVLDPNSLPPPGIGSPSGPPSPTGRTLSTSGCRTSTPAPGRPTSTRPNCPP